jgi:hypothetical protein
LIARLLHPTRTPPPPVDIDLARVMLAGTGVWVVALLVSVVLAATDEASWMPTWVCATGVGLGFLGVLWARRHAVR